MMKPVWFSCVFDMWSDSSACILTGWQCPEILLQSLQPGFTTGVNLFAQIILFFIVETVPQTWFTSTVAADMKSKGNPGLQITLAFPPYLQCPIGVTEGDIF